MMNRNFSRRKFIKTGLAAGTVSLLGPSEMRASDKKKKSVTTLLNAAA